MTYFSTYLTKEREQLGLSKKEMAQAIGWTPMYYGRFETDDLYPSERNIPLFAKALKVSESDIRNIIFLDKRKI